MKRIVFAGFLIILGMISYCQKPYDILTTAYKNNSVEQLDDFLQGWHNSYIPISNYDNISDLQKDVYIIYQDFYNPFELSKYGREEHGEDLYSEVDYVVIQNLIEIKVINSDSLEFGVFDNIDTLVIINDRINNFRPNFKFDKAEVLFLTPEYEKILLRFLKDKHLPLGAGGIMNPARAKGKSLEKQDFINKKFLIIYGHWGGYWHLETHPYVFSIWFNKNLTTAKVNFRLVYQGGEANYYKENGIWIFKNAYLTWIE